VRDRALKLGILSDLHYEPEPTGQRSWINPYDVDGLPARIESSLQWFSAEEVDIILAAGDLVERPQEQALDEILELLTSGDAPVALVAGNHDWDGPGLIRTKAIERDCAVLDAAPIHEVFTLVGVSITPVGRDAVRFAGVLDDDAVGAGVIVSHFPLLSEADRLAAAGLPYPGDLINRSALTARVEADSAAVLILSGHIHARCARSTGSVLQLTCGALIEPPHDAAVVTVAAGLNWVERTARRHGPVAEIDPVFAPDFERWELVDAHWRRVPEGSP
jgi:predicted phosphodiesterase